MKKSLLSGLVLTAIAGLAHAETSVQLYGLVDAGVGYSQTKVSYGDSWVKTRDIGLVDGIGGTNNWGLKGIEDLGNGTSAIFQLESGFSLGTGHSLSEGTLFDRRALVGLTGADWGTVTLGRQFNVADDILSPLDPFGTNFGQAGVTAGAFGDSVSANMSDSIKYMSPTWSGFQFGLGYSGRNEKTEYSSGAGRIVDKDTSNWITAGLSYVNGPLAVAATYDRFRSDVTVSDESTKSTTNMWNVGLTYDFTAVKAHLMYGQTHGALPATGLSSGLIHSLDTALVDDGDSGLLSGTSGYRQQAWLAGLTIPVGDAGRVLLSYQGNHVKNSDTVYDKARGTLHIGSIGYSQDLSKRTTLYAVASYGSGSVRFDALDDKVKLKSTLVAAGIQHRF
ncbi:porin [Advenella mimigardefordensis]|uniref:Outer membrane porin protein n=1 Tax=Advenella mimigardefordensis (strain DSM 17166 / LMG 22922 / DPN7) TaxID=1247726 RepID=W0PE77_ADVMD|nr:porin [Advenella mimigardefordensis]AHG63777.1 outer membrane porin protein [Advenella mimigardefordensis DPN7]